MNHLGKIRRISFPFKGHSRKLQQNGPYTMIVANSFLKKILIYPSVTKVKEFGPICPVNERDCPRAEQAKHEF